MCSGGAAAYSFVSRRCIVCRQLAESRLPLSNIPSASLDGGEADMQTEFVVEGFLQLSV